MVNKTKQTDSFISITEANLHRNISSKIKQQQKENKQKKNLQKKKRKIALSLKEKLKFPPLLARNSRSRLKVISHSTPHHNLCSFWDRTAFLWAGYLQPYMSMRGGSSSTPPHHPSRGLLSTSVPCAKR